MMDAENERVARALFPEYWRRWDDRANRPYAEKLLGPVIQDTLAMARSAIAALATVPGDAS